MGAVAVSAGQALPRVAVALNVARARLAFQALEAWLLREEASQLPLQEVEREQDCRGREIQRLLLEAHVAQRGPGDVGPAVAVRTTDPADEEVLQTQRRLDPRHPQTIFGEITVTRLGYRELGFPAVQSLSGSGPAWSRARRASSGRWLRRCTGGIQVAPTSGWC